MPVVRTRTQLDASHIATSPEPLKSKPPEEGTCPHFENFQRESIRDFLWTNLIPL